MGLPVPNFPIDALRLRERCEYQTRAWYVARLVELIALYREAAAHEHRRDELPGRAFELGWLDREFRLKFRAELPMKRQYEGQQRSADINRQKKKAWENWVRKTYFNRQLDLESDNKAAKQLHEDWPPELGKPRCISAIRDCIRTIRAGLARLPDSLDLAEMKKSI